MEGAGNDFVVAYRHDLPRDASPTLAPALCDRHFGVGADGVLIIDLDPPGMTVWNADGSVAEMCGNGLRCVAHRLAEDGHWANGDLVLCTGAGLRRARRAGELFEVEVGPPEGAGPLRVAVNDRVFEGTAVDMGNPHYVVFTDPDELLRWGPALERHDAFPRRANVEFVERLPDGALRVRVFERGVGETLACGSGACAVAAAALRGTSQTEQRLLLPGGELRVRWSGREGDSAWLVGPARTVYSGIWAEATALR